MNKLYNFCVDDDIKEHHDLLTNANSKYYSSDQNINMDCIYQDDLVYPSDMSPNMELTDVCHELEIDTLVLKSLNKTYTKGGQHYLKGLLTRPISDIKVLAQRQINFIKLSETFQMSEDMDLNILTKKESSIYKWLDLGQESHQELIQTLYYNNFILKRLSLNTNSTSLSIKNFYRIIISPSMCVLSPLLYLLIPYLIIILKFKLNISLSLYLRMMMKYYTGTYITGIGGSDSIWGSRIKMFSMFWTGLSLLMYITNTLNTVELSRITFKINKLIHCAVIDLLIFIDIGYKNSLKLSLENIRLIYNITENDYNNIIIPSGNKISEFYQNFRQSSKNGNYYSMNNLINTGDILTTWKYLTDNAENIKLLINYIYITDAIISITKLYKQEIIHPVVFIDSRKKGNSAIPIIECDGLCHPCLLKNNSDLSPIRNSISIGRKHGNMLLTGPNAAGKSTILKAIGVNIILAQTIGMSSCYHMKFTPLYYLGTRINIRDNIGTLSLYQAEMARMVKFATFAKEFDKVVNSPKFSILLLDELFNSTNIIEGVSGSYGICKAFGKIRTNITVLATHFTELHKLEEELDVNFINHKMIAICSDNGKWTFPYTLEKGVSHQYIALELMREQISQLNKSKSSNIVLQDILTEALLYKNSINNIIHV